MTTLVPALNILSFSPTCSRGYFYIYDATSSTIKFRNGDMDGSNAIDLLSTDTDKVGESK
jgi:hypothetical protein